MAYTSIDRPSDYFSTKLYTGNGSTQSITGVGFQPDWIAIKRRNAASGTQNMDSVRGAAKKLAWNETSAEESPGNILSSFDSDGFSVGNSAAVNGSSDTFVAWNWKAGTSFTNDASSTGIGTIDSTGSFNNDSGFSIVSYSGTGGAGTIKHGLSTAPSMIIVKVRTGRTSDWLVYHKGIASDAQTDCIKLNESGASFDEATIWNDTAPTSSVFSVGTEDTVSGSGNTFIAYCFAEKKGYSKFGSYVGNGSTDGTYVHLGFSPAFVIIKRTNTTANWIMLDNKRNPFNVVNKVITPNRSNAEFDTTTFDALSNGFKAKESDVGNNASGSTYIYMAFAEHPFVTSTGIPTTAR